MTWKIIGFQAADSNNIWYCFSKLARTHRPAHITQKGEASSGYSAPNERERERSNSWLAGGQFGFVTPCQSLQPVYDAAATEFRRTQTLTRTRNY